MRAATARRAVRPTRRPSPPSSAPLSSCRTTLGRLREPLNRAGVLQAHDRLVLAQTLGVDGKAAAVLAMGLDRPQQDRVPAEEGVAQALAVAGAPQLLPAERAPDGAPQQPPHH